MKQVCGKEYDRAVKCASNVNEEQIMQQMFEISSQHCPRQLKKYNNCAESKLEGECGKEFFDTILCASYKVLKDNGESP